MTDTTFLLERLATEWDALLRNAEISDIYSQQADELTIVCSGDSLSALRVGTKGPLRYLFRSNRVGKPRKNVTDLLPACHGKKITSVTCVNGDRALACRLDNGSELIIVCFGNTGSVLLATGGLIEDAFGYHRRFIGESLPEFRQARWPSGTAELNLQEWQGSQLTGTLRKKFVAFSQTMLSELEHRFAEEIKTNGEAPPLSELLLREANSIVEESKNGSARMYMTSPVTTVSTIEMRHLGAEERRTFDTVDELCREHYVRGFDRARFEVRRDALSKPLKKRADRLGKSLEGIRAQLAKKDRAEIFEKWGHLLMAQSSLSERGKTRLIVQDLFGSGEEDIPLDPKLSILENAQRYYQKSNKVKGALEEGTSRSVDLERHLEETQTLIEELEQVDTIEMLKQFEATNESTLDRLFPKSTEENTLPYRRFEVEGYTILVGKNSRQNDELTFKHASPHDYWFHARGFPGSHVVLVVKDKNKKPQPAAIEGAARIAAYYSKAKGSKLAPVIVTQKKYVRKARRGNPGQAIVTNEDVLLVEPGLPTEKE